MHRIRASLALVVSLAACSKARDNPSLQFSDIGYALHLPPAMQAALDSLAPGFQMVRTTAFRSDVPQAAAEGAGSMQALFAEVGDFDADGAADAVVEGAAPGDTGLRVIAILNTVKPIAVDVTRIAEYDADAVGVYLAPPPAGSPGAFQVVNYPDSTMLYTYRKGAFIGSKVGN
jgi:hypothetical protein